MGELLNLEARFNAGMVARMGDKRYKGVPASWVPALVRWVLELEATGRSPASVALRRAHVSQLARAVRSSPAELDVEELLAYLASRSWARETRRSHRASLRSFFHSCDRDDLVELVPRVTPAEPLPRPTPDAELAAAMALADDRTRLVLRLAAEAGLRRGEIAQIHAHDLGRDLLGDELLVHGKGGKLRTVPLDAGLAGAVRRRAAGGWLFPGGVDGHLSARRVGELAVGVLPAPWTLHSLRHRFATRAHDATGDLVAVSRLLGHASVATTQRYVATGADRLRRVAAAAA